VEKYYGHILFYCVFIVSGSFHEAAHAWSAWRLGDPTARDHGRMTLNPLSHIDPIGTVLFPLMNIFFGAFFIGWMRPVPVYTPNLNDPRRHSLLVSLAGPFSNLLIAFLSCAVLAALSGTELLTVNVLMLLQAFIIINLLLAAFNLLPIPPLDGSSIVDYIRRDPNETYHRQGGIGIIILYAMLLLGLLRYLWEGADHAAAFILSDLWIPFALLAAAAAAAGLFWARTGPGGAVRPRRVRAPAPRLAAERDLVRARAIAEALAGGRPVADKDRRWFETISRDRGDGQPLCSSVSFDTDNEFCWKCRNLNRCIVRAAEEALAGDGECRDREYRDR
jgi:Zn-dependent protease